MEWLTHTHTFTPTTNFANPSGQRPEETEENMQIAHKKDSWLSLGSNWGPSYCEATVVTQEG